MLPASSRISISHYYGLIMNSTAPQNASAAVEGGLSTSMAVTKVIDRIPRAGMDAQLEQSIKNLNVAALRLPGHLGVTVIRPSLPAQPGFRIVYRFDSCEHLRTWEESDEYVRLESIANGYTQGEPRRQVFTGLETWFTLPAQSSAPHPRRGRMTVVTWIGIFPLVYVYERVVSSIMSPGTPILLRIAVITALVVPTMSYLVSPQLIRLFKKWLYPGPG
jgi:antibiotic biosynthesis monooxygenase (ABM) superfamily enzyme